MSDPKHVRCPRCQTVFRLPPGTLEAAGGRVRCGRCSALFDGRAETVPAAAPAIRDATPEPGPAGEPALGTGSGEPAEARPKSAVPAPEAVFGLDGEVRDGSRRARRPGASLLLAFANVVLFGLLGVQLFLGLSEPLFASPELRPWLERGCAIVGCRLPALRNPERVEILARDVRAHPRYANGLLVDVTLVNRAPYVQPFPVMQLTFTSLDAQWFAQRRFQPAEYLGPNRGTSERLPPDIPVQVVLELLDPGPEAVSYQFDFL